MAHIAVLAELVRVAPDTFESKSDVLVTFLVTKVLMAPPSHMVILETPDCYHVLKPLRT